ncbi:MAG TPA: hypothetical protein VM533_13755 [Fimbriiglobus sp.]|jgi:hypothetical protein|nr:hypothetical protein [Fimbriiglobus sp.]
MRARFAGLVGLVGAIAATVGPEAVGQPSAPKPVWAFAHDLRVRKGGEKDFTPETPKVGVEFFKDEAGGALVAVTQVGDLEVVPAGQVGAEKKAAWLFAHDLRARKGDEEKFTASTTKYGVEAFKDTATGKILYVSEKATVALADAPGSVAADKEPAWHHALVLKVRGPNEKEWANARKFGVEAFKDGNTGGLIYVTETGSLACLPAPPQPPAPDKVKPPTALYGLELRVRKADEPDFTGNTKKVGVEVFRDENTGGLLYISETGSVAAVPAPAQVKSGGGVDWRHAMTLKARPGGVNEFEKANKFGVEVFQDKNTGYLVYASETGAIAVLAKK